MQKTFFLVVKFYSSNFILILTLNCLHRLLWYAALFSIGRLSVLGQIVNVRMQVEYPYRLIKINLNDSFCIQTKSRQTAS